MKHAFALVDSGYCSEDNILLLRKAKIDFLTRLPAGRSLYKNLILNHTENLESVDRTYQYGKRALFIKKVKNTRMLRKIMYFFESPVSLNNKASCFIYSQVYYIIV